MLVFLTAVFFLLISPGPGVLSTAGVGSAFGAKAAYRYVFGLFIGTNFIALAVVTGLAGLMLANPVARTVLLFTSVSYLCYLALRIALAGSKIHFIENKSPPGILNGIALQALNPKAYVVNTTLFTSFAFQQVTPLQEILWKFLIINLIWIPIHLLWMAAGIALKRMNLSAKKQRAINLLMAGSLLLVVALAVIFRPA